MKAPTLTAHTAGFSAAKRAARFGYTAPDMSNDTLRHIAADLAREHMKQAMDKRPKLTQRQGVAVFHSFFVGFLDNTCEQLHRPSFLEFYGRR